MGRAKSKSALTGNVYGELKMGKHHSPNDNRSISKNPSNPAYKASVDNRSVQIKENKSKE